MPNFILSNFLYDPTEYAEAEAFWAAQWHDLLHQTGQQDRWMTPWLNTSFADGTPFRDGNPIFSAISPSQHRAIRIIQLEPAENPGEIYSWVDTCSTEASEEIKELVISCALSPETQQVARDLIQGWILRGEVAGSEGCYPQVPVPPPQDSQI